MVTLTGSSCDERTQTNTDHRGKTEERPYGEPTRTHSRDRRRTEASHPDGVDDIERGLKHHRRCNRPRKPYHAAGNRAAEDVLPHFRDAIGHVMSFCLDEC